MQQQLDDLIDRLGIGDWILPVALLVADRQKMMLLLYVAWQLNKTVIPLDPALPESAIAALLDRCGCGVVVSDRKLVQLDDDIRIMDVNANIIDKVKRSTGTKHDAQLIVATSGSTGEAKLAILPCKAIKASALAVNIALTFSRKDCWLNCLPLYHIAGLAIVYRSIYADASMLLHSSFDAKTIWHDLKQYSVTHISLVPAMLAKLLDEASGCPPPDTLAVALIGGGQLSPALAQRAHGSQWPIVISYGMTETGSLCAYDDSPEAGLQAGKVGQVLAGFKISLYGEQQRICIQGDALMSGYVGDDGLPNGRLLTRDVGIFDTRGLLYITGRLDDVLISGGKNIQPQEVEEQLQQMAGITDVAVSSIDDEVWGDKLVALFVADQVGAEQFEEWGRQHLASAIRPRLYLRLNQLPRNALGKLERKKLKQLCIKLESFLRIGVGVNVINLR